MHRTLLSLCLITAVACTSTTPTPALTPVAPPPAAPATPVAAEQPCDPGLVLLNASLWVQHSAEYRAAALQTFASARRSLDAALADPSLHGALEETGGDSTQPPAIVLDLDETILDNSAFETRPILQHMTYDRKLWKAWVAESIARAVPGATEFLAYAASKGVTPFYITNRDLEEEPGTRRNLEKLGFPLNPAVDTLLVQGKNGWTTSDKSPRRAHVAASYRILLVLGDDLNDFAPASGKTMDERNAIIESARDRWGQSWFILPNPMYGSWERALFGTGGTPCEQVQRRIDALRAQ